jgi:hypothetical protein
MSVTEIPRAVGTIADVQHSRMRDGLPTIDGV